MTWIDQTFLILMLVGFIAQLIDGALGMAYGITATTALMALGMPPVIASANVHTAEVFTCAASGASHWRAGNVDWRLVKHLAPFGVVGAIIGAALASAIDTSLARPIIAAYLLYMGGVVFVRAFRRRQPQPRTPPLRLLGLAGGICDAVGGGGWGPIVASRLVADGGDSAKTIGSTNLAEFFMTTAASVTFFFSLDAGIGKAALALVLGGVVAAPIAAYVTRRLPHKTLMAAVGILICTVSLVNLRAALS